MAAGGDGRGNERTERPADRPAGVQEAEPSYAAGESCLGIEDRVEHAFDEPENGERRQDDEPAGRPRPSDERAEGDNRRRQQGGVRTQRPLDSVAGKTADHVQDRARNHQDAEIGEGAVEAQSHGRPNHPEETVGNSEDHDKRPELHDRLSDSGIRSPIGVLIH
jgi:hypothetical protein